MKKRIRFLASLILSVALLLGLLPGGVWADMEYTSLEIEIYPVQAGRNPDFHIKGLPIGTERAAGYPVSDYQDTGTRWEDDTTGETLDFSDVFVAGHEYTLCIALRAKDGFFFHTNSDGEVKVTCTVNGEAAIANNLSVSGYEDGSKYLRIQYTTTAYELTPVESVSFSLPVPANRQGWSYTDVTAPEDSPYTLDYDNNEDGYCHGVRWQGVNVLSYLDQDELFIGGREYICYLSAVTSGKGRYFDMKNPPAVSVNGQPAEIFGNYSENRIVLKARFTAEYDAVDSVAFTVSQPVNAISCSAAIVMPVDAARYECDKTGGGFNMGISWRDLTEDRVLESWESFIGGHSYTCSIAAVPQQGYIFAKPFVGAEINGEAVEYEFTPERIVLTSKPFYVETEEIGGVSFNILEPYWMDEAEYYLNIFSVVSWSDGSYYVEDGEQGAGIAWVDNADGHTMENGDRFCAGHSYTCRLTVMSNPGYLFGGDVSAEINGQPAVIEEYTLGRLVIAAVFPIGAVTLDTVNLGIFAEPFEGEVPRFSANSDTVGCAVRSVEWYNETDEQTMTAAMYFEAGKLYTLTCVIESESGCEFRMEGVNPGFDAAVNGKPATAVRVGDEDPRFVAAVRCSFTAGVNTITDFWLELPGPLAGEKPAPVYDWQPGVLPVSVKWIDLTEGETPLGAEDVFIEGHSYRAVLVLAADISYGFNTLKGEPNVSVTFNEKKLPKANISAVPEKEAEKQIQIYYDFKPCQAAVRFFELSLSGNEPGNTPADVLITPPGALYQVVSVKWTNDELGAVLTEDALFEAGAVYVAEILLQRSTELPFEADMDRYDPLYFSEASVNGLGVSVDVAGELDPREYASVTFWAPPCGVTLIDAVELNGLVPPTPGTTAADYLGSLALTVPEDAPYTLGDVFCGGMNSDDVFMEEVDYAVCVELEARPGYGFRAAWSYGEFITFGEYTVTADCGEGMPWQYEGYDGRFSAIVRVEFDAASMPSIRFDANGGLGNPPLHYTIEKGSTYYLPACAFLAPEGKTFRAWLVQGEEKAPGEAVVVTESIVITALWDSLVHEHVPGEAVTENEVPASCEAEGCFDTVVYCTECGEELSRETTVIPALGHDWGEWAVLTEPTCTEAGQRCRDCAACGMTEFEDIPALGHDWDSVVTEPGCTEQGYTTHSCSRCGESYTDTFLPPTGDMDGDGLVTAADVRALFDKVSGAPVSFVSTAQPDVNGDGKLNDRDAMLLFRLAVK